MIRPTSVRCILLSLFAAATLAASARPIFAQSFLAAYERGSGEFELDFTIGGDIEDEDYYLAGPVDLALDAQGSLFVLDSRNFCIKKFDADGRFLKTFGRQGEGPGEMAGPLAIETYPDGRVFLNDFQNRRLTRYDNDGNCIDTRSLADFGWRFVVGVRIDRAGNVYLQSSKTDYADVEKKTQTLISRLDFDSMTETMIDSAAFRQTLTKETGRGATVVSAPYYPELLWGVKPDGDVVVANSSDYSIKIYSPDLSLRSETVYKGERRAVTKEDKEEYFTAFDGEELVLWMRANIDFPKYQPYFDSLIIDSEGYLLFLVGGEDSTQAFDVFTPKGDFLNSVSLPRIHRNAVLSGGFIYTIARGDEDPVVRRYRLK